MSTLNTMRFGLEISAKDNTGPGLRSVLSSITNLAIKPITIPFKIGTGALGILRDINLGLAPVIRGIDQLVTRAGHLETARKSFESLTGSSGNKATYMARQLVDAANGTLRLSVAMRLANKALSDGFSTDKLNTVFRFASFKAASIGEDTEGVIGGLLRGLGTGDFRALKQFGLDVGDVADSYARIKGVGAFDDLPYAERRAVVIAAALKKMVEESRKIGLSGKELIFVWEGFKNSIGDAADSITRVVAGSKQFKAVLESIKSIGQGVAKFLENGGSIVDAMAAGLKVVGAAFLDIGESAGRMIAAGIMRGILAAAPDLAKSLGIEEGNIVKIEMGIGFERFHKAVDDLKKVIGPAMGGGGKPGDGGPQRELTKAEQRRIKGELRGLDREESRARGDTDFAIRRDAARRANEEIRGRAAAGEQIDSGERNRIIQRIRKEETDKRLDDIRARRAALKERLGGGGAGVFGGGGGAGGIVQGGGFAGPAAQPSGGSIVGSGDESQADRGSRAASGTFPRGRLTGWGGSPLSTRHRETKQELADRLRKQGRMQIEALPQQIADDIGKLVSNFRSGFMGGSLNAQDRDFFVKSAMGDIEALDRATRGSGMGGRGFSIDRFKLRDGTPLGKVLNEFEDFLGRERGVNEPEGPMGARRRISPERARLRRIRGRSADRAYGAGLRMLDDAQGRLIDLSDEQSLLTRRGLVDIAGAGRMERYSRTRPSELGPRPNADGIIPGETPQETARRWAREKFAGGRLRAGDPIDDGTNGLLRAVHDAIWRMDKEKEAHGRFAEGVGKIDQGRQLEPLIKQQERGIATIERMLNEIRMLRSDVSASLSSLGTSLGVQAAKLPSK